jgi:hypothetical protein
MEQYYGWYSLNAYKNGEKEYIYMDKYNQSILCTIITKDKNIPYDKESPYIDVVYCGIIYL